MFKYLIIVFLLIVDFYSFNYLTNSYNSRNEYVFYCDSTPLIINKKEIDLYSIEDFNFEDYFETFSFNETSYSYNFDEEFIHIKLSVCNMEYEYSYPYKIIEKEVITEIVYKNIYVNKPVINSNQPTIEYTNESVNKKDDNQNENTINNIVQPSFILNRTSLSYETDTDISVIVSGISSSFVANEYVALDYAQLNSSCPGNYPVYLYPASGGTYIIWISIQ